MKKLILSRKNLEKIFIAAILLAIPLYPKFPFLEIPNVSVRIRLEDFLIFFLGLYVLGRYISRFRELIRNPLERSIVLFLVAGLISSISGYFLTSTVLPHVTLLHWARRIEYLIPLFFALSLDRKNLSEYLNFTVKLILICIVILFIYGMGQKYLSFPVIVTQNSEVSKGIALRFVEGAHLSSTFAGHYDLATFLVLTLPVVVGTIFTLKGKLMRLILFLVFIAGLWLLANTLSRISVASYLLAITVTMMIMRKFKGYLIILLISLLVFSLSTNLLDRYLSIIRVAKESVNKIMIIQVPTAFALGPALPGGSHLIKPSVLAAFEDRSTSIRVNVEWPRAIRAFEKNPLLGTGYSSITLATDNDYLRLLGEVGIAGILAFFLIIARITQSLLASLRNRDRDLKMAYAAGMAGAFLGELLSATFIDIFEASKFALVFWFLIGLLVITVRVSKKHENA